MGSGFLFGLLGAFLVTRILLRLRYGGCGGGGCGGGGGWRRRRWRGDWSHGDGRGVGIGFTHGPHGGPGASPAAA